MKLTAADIAELSSLLDQALDLTPAQREEWLAHSVGGGLGYLVPSLRAMLALEASGATGYLIDKPPVFTAAGGALAAGDQIGPYRLIRELGIGGMGSVWLAERSDGSLKRKVALKLPHLGWIAGLGERFEREREILSGLEHPHIARLYDAGLDPKGRPYMALEYVDGLPIDEYCRQRGLGVPQRLALLLQVAEAVAFAHSRLVVHRDLKPGNILVSDDGQVHLLDFGIAKLLTGDRAQETALTQAAGRALTLDYASPEQIRGEPIGTASDVYSLGVVAFELLSGHRPYRLQRGSGAELEEAITAQEVPTTSSMAQDVSLRRLLRGDLDAILNKALKKRPEARYATVDALAQDWRRHLAGKQVQARPDSIGYRLSRWSRQYRAPLAATSVTAVAFGVAIGAGATALVIAALLLGMGIAAWQAAQARRQAASARQEAKRAQVVLGFVVDLFQANSTGQVDPVAAQQTTARELLDRGALRIDEALRDDPQSRFEVLRVLANIYWQLTLWKRAAELERACLALARQRFGPNDTRLVSVILDYAARIEDFELRDEIPALTEEAMSGLVAAGLETSELMGQALAIQADYWRHGSLRLAAEAAERSLALLERHHADSDHVIAACTNAARVCIYLGKLERAAELGARGLEAARRLKQDAVWQYNPMSVRSDALFTDMRLDAAEAQLRAELTLAIQLYGDGSNGRTLSSKARLCTLLYEVGRVDEADALRESVQQALAADSAGAAEVSMRPYVRYLLGLRLLERGRPDQLVPMVQFDIDENRRTHPNSPFLSSHLKRSATMHAALGCPEAARPALSSAQEIWDKYASGTDTRYTDTLYTLVRAQIELADDNPRRALDELERIDPIGRRGLVLYHLERARCLLAMQRLEESAAAATHALSCLHRAPGGLWPIANEADAHLLLGLSRLGCNEPHAAEPELRRSLALRLQHDLADSLWVAQSHIALAECRITLGGTQDAAESLAHARRIHATLGAAAKAHTGALNRASALLQQRRT